jgi:hypothetical protein
VSEKLRFKPYWIAVAPDEQYALEKGIHSAGFSDFIVGDAEEIGTLEEIEREFAPSTAQFL